MSQSQQEWDYPPRARRYRVLDAVPEESGWGSPTATRIVSGYWTFVKTVLKVIVSSVCTVVLFGCIWLLWQIFKVAS